MHTIAAFLEVDKADLSEVERGQRRLIREQVIKLAGYFEVNENDLLVTWLSDKVVYKMENEDMAMQALQLAENKLNFISHPKIRKANSINSIKSVLKNDGRVANAWLFGSYARGQEKLNSDVNLMIELITQKK